jgi:adenylate cyclase class IV
MAHFEIEIKSLLGSQEAADALLEKMQINDANTKIIGKSIQLNHYFTGGNIDDLFGKVEFLFDEEKRQKFKMIVKRGSDFSIRTRQKDDEVLLVVKASLDGGTSANTVSRLEFEEPVNLSLSELDALLEEAGYTYQAKWSRSRIEYTYKDVTVCLDKNAGYGYVAEFETVTHDEDSLSEVKKKLEEHMMELGVEELPQERLARMFAYYNEFWPEYYGTDKTFTIE